GLGLVHAAHRGADRHGHLDSRAVVAAVGDRVLAELLGRPLLDHALVVHEPAGGQHDAAGGAVLALRTELGGVYAHHAAVLDDERADLDVALQGDTRLLGGGHERV